MSPPTAPAASNGAASVPLLETRGLSRHFRLGGMFSRRMLHALDDVDLTIGEAEIVALVGESGSGKSTMVRLLARVHAPTAGEIRFAGHDLAKLRSRKDVLDYRAKVPMVFQDPFSSLNPAFRIAHGLMRCLKLHRPDLSREQRRAEAERVLTSVGLTPAADYLAKFPHELSGGQRQRVGFAQALAVRPRLILADEPVSMLDVSIRAGILNLMADLRARERVSFLYVTHDLASARYVADRLVVLYAGRVVESGPTEDVLEQPKHPYTRLLLSAVPDPRAPLAPIGAGDVGEPPRIINPGPGCRFRQRCPLAIDVCGTTPLLRTLRPGHDAACHVATVDAPATADAAVRPAHAPNATATA